MAGMFAVNTEGKGVCFWSSLFLEECKEALLLAAAENQATADLDAVLPADAKAGLRALPLDGCVVGHRPQLRLLRQRVASFLQEHWDTLVPAAMHPGAHTYAQLVLLWHFELTHAQQEALTAGAKAKLLKEYALWIQKSSSVSGSLELMAYLHMRHEKDGIALAAETHLHVPGSPQQLVMTAEYSMSTDSMPPARVLRLLLISPRKNQGQGKGKAAASEQKQKQKQEQEQCIDLTADSDSEEPVQTDEKAGSSSRKRSAAEAGLPQGGAPAKRRRLSPAQKPKQMQEQEIDEGDHWMLLIPQSEADALREAYAGVFKPQSKPLQELD